MNPTEISNNKRLANYLRIQLGELNTFIDNEYIINKEQFLNEATFLKGNNSNLIINKYSLRKKKIEYGQRVIYEPASETLINCLKVLTTHLNKIYMPPESAHGFVKGKGIKSNAQNHLTKKFLLYSFRNTGVLIIKNS